MEGTAESFFKYFCVLHIIIIGMYQKVLIHLNNTHCIHSYTLSFIDFIVASLWLNSRFQWSCHLWMHTWSPCLEIVMNAYLEPLSWNRSDPHVIFAVTSWLLWISSPFIVVIREDAVPCECCVSPNCQVQTGQYADAHYHDGALLLWLCLYVTESHKWGRTPQ
jgi:hypothetical protein